MQEFHDAKRQTYDLRAAILWDLQRSWNEISRAEGKHVFNENIRVTPETTAMLDLTLRCSMTEDGVASLPKINDLHWQLTSAASKYINLLERYPDGRTDPDDE